MLPVIPKSVNDLIQDPQGNISTYPFPDNVAAHPAMTDDVRKEIFAYMLSNYIWPQIMERKPFEQRWKKLLSMARAALKISGADLDENTRLKQKRRDRIKTVPTERGVDQTDIADEIEVSDTVIFDAIDRQTNLAQFVAYKEGFPVQYNIPEDMEFPYENDVYSPMSALVKSANAWLKFNAQQHGVYRKAWMARRHHYTYGMSFASSEFVQKIEPVPRRQPDKTFKDQMELTQIGITFEPMSCRKLWLNYRLPVDKMDYQHCPFFFEEMPRFAIIANKYDPQLNPFGYVNQEKLQAATYLFGASELESYMENFTKRFPGETPGQLLDADFSFELLWTFYPMLPLTFDDQTGAFIFDKDGDKGVPMKRFIVQTFGNNLCNGGMEIIRLQANFYPNDSIPLYGSAHIPTLDDGAYPDAIGDILESHYFQICKCLLQYIENKDWANDPPTEVMVGSPAMGAKINRKGIIIPVNGPNDIKRREAFDLTQTTPQVYHELRDAAKTSSKSTDALLGKAMGARTSATEASNIFQTSMSGITTEVNLQTCDIEGGYATRVWDYTGRWVDPDILARITGSYGFAIRPEHMAIRFGLRWDCGSTFVENITRQSNIRYMLESSVGDPSINRAALWTELLTLWKFKNVRSIVNDQGTLQQIQMATEQAIQTYLGQFVLIDPDQDHAIALKVKKSFLTDRKSVWNTTQEYVINGPKLVLQMQQHQLYLQLLQQQQQLEMIRNSGLDAQGTPNPLQSLQSGNGGAPPQVQSRGGQLAQAGGGRL